MNRILASIVKPPYRGLPWLVSLYVALCVWLLDRGGVFTGHLIGYDDQVRMAQVLNWVNGAGWYDRTLMRANPPDGFTTIWSRIVDIPIAAVVVVAQQFTTQKVAALVAATVVPMLELAVLFVAAPYFVRPLVGKAKARLIVLFLIFTSLLNVKYFSVSGFIVGEASHHPWYVILDLTMFGAAARLAMGSASLSPVLMLGGSIALLTAVGIEGYPMIAGAAALLASTAWAGNRPMVAMRGAAGILCGAAGSLLLLPMHVPPSHFFEVSFAEPSILGVILVTAAGGYLKCEQFILQKCAPQKALSALFLLIVAGMLGGGLIAAFPQMLDGAAAGLSPQERAMALHDHYEALPIYKLGRSPSETIGLLAPIFIAFGLGMYGFTVTRGRRRVAHFCYLGFAVIGGGMSLQFSRFYHHAMTTACAWLLWGWEAFKYRLKKNKNYSLFALGGFVALGPFWMLLLHAIAYDTPFVSQVLLFPAAIQVAFDPCDPLSMADYIDDHYPASTLLAVPSWHSQHFFYQADVRIDFLANYPSQNKFIDNFNLFGPADAETAREIAARHRLDLIAVCRVPNAYNPNLPDAAQGMLGLLQTGHVPRWLKWVPTPGVSTNFVLYEIDKSLVNHPEAP